MPFAWQECIRIRSCFFQKTVSLAAQFIYLWTSPSGSRPLVVHDYFTFIKINGAAFKVKFVKDFNAVLSNRQLVYEFFIPCHVPASDTVKKVTVASYDPSYYAALSFADAKPVALEKAEKFAVTTSVREDLNTKIYFDMIHPWTLFLEFRKQS